MNLTIGNISIGIKTPHKEVTDFCRDRYKNFISSGKRDFVLEVEFFEKSTPADYLGVQKKDIAYFLDPASKKVKKTTAQKGNRPDIIDYRDRILITRSDFAGIVQLKEKRGKVVVKKNQITMGLDSFLRICYSFLVLNYNGLVVHSAGLVKNRKGYIFFGVSETGKSTISALSQEFTTILSDEIIVIRKDKKKYYVYGSPFYGTLNYHAINKKAPLSAAFMPVKDTEIYIKKANPILYLSRFLSAVLFFGKEPELIARVLDIAHDFMDTVPSYEMHFQKNSKFWKHIDKLRT